MDDDLKSASSSLTEASERPAYQPKLGKKPSKSLKLPLIIGGCLIILIVGGFILWKFVINKPKTAPAVVISTAVKPTTPADDIADVPATETYSSKALSVGFKYPKTWLVSEANGGIRVDSPTFNVLPVEQASQTAIFRVYIRQGARAVDGKYIGAGVAIKPSEKLTYSQPALGQRTDTLLSSFGIDSPDYFSFFLIAGNFQLKKGDTLGPNYGKEPDTYIVIGGYASPTAVDDLATLPVPLTYYMITNAYKQATAIIASLQLK